MNIKEFTILSRERKMCPHCRGDNIEVYRHPSNYDMRLVYCKDCFGYPSICLENEQTYISDDIRRDKDYCKICGDRELLMKTHHLADI